MRDYVEQIDSLRLCAESDDPVDECCWEDCNQHHGSRDNMCRQKIMMDAADAIEELLAAVPKWISVEDALPEENKNYLTYGVFLPLGVKAMDMNRFDGTKWLTSADVEITHWMPLPEQPKEAQDG